eukprot:Skav217251  [mRNA]  locus=scaffold47:369148:372975:- [translate_table: standard]
MEEERKTERSRSRKITLVERKREEEPDTDEAEWDTTSVTSAGVMEGDLEALQVMREWLRSEDTGGLTVAQSGALLALTARRSGTALGKYLERMVLGSDGARNSRQRSLLPLPLKEDSKLALRELFESGEYRRLAGTWGAKKDAKTKAAKVARKTGMLIWHGLLVTTVNVLQTGGSKDAAIHSGPVTKAQEMALERFWEAIRVFVDDTSESKEKVPRSTGVGEWGAKLGDVRISYEGEVIEKAHRITLDQVLPGLPPKGYGGSVPLVELCEGELKEKLLRPESNLMAEENWPEDIPAPKVHADIEQWEKLAHELHQRGLIEAVEDPILVKGKPLRNGAFGVVKAGKFLPDERPVLRLIMDFRAINSVTTVLTGDIKTLTGAPALQHIVLPEGHVLRMSTDDLVAAFYLFQLPPGWSRMMTFSAPVSWKMLGVDKPGKVLVGARVLPMGWASAVGVLQHAHRRLALRSPLQGGGGLLGRCEIRRDTPFPDLGTENKVWSLYLDDTNLVEMMLARVGKEMQGKPSEEQQRLRQAYEHWGIPISLEKALERAQKAEKLGAVIDGDAGLVRTAMKRAIDSISLGMWLLRQDRAPRKALQVFLGKEVHSLQFRRPLFAIFDYLWKEIASGEVMLELGLKSVEEVLLAGFCQPLRFTDLKAKLNEVVTASDASETGGGMVYSSKLTTQGIRDTVTAKGGLDATPEYGLPADDEQKVVVFDFFSGIGGLSRALEHAQMGVERLVIVESDRECRRLNKNRWPGCEVICDIRSMTKKDIEKVVRSVPGVTGIIGAGGSPCQGLSKLSVNRSHLDDPRSALFYKLKEVLDWIGEVGREMKLWTLRFVENVLADPEDIEEMSRALQQRPVLVCSSGLSRVRRPRLFWANVELDDHPSFQRRSHKLYDEVVFEEATEPLEKVGDAGWTWKHGAEDETLRLPTFTRAIPRKKPPPSPAGLSTCDEETVKRWQGDKMKFPPYTYRREFLWEKVDEPDELRVASANEREVLMGFRRGHTLALFKDKPKDGTEAEGQEVSRCAAVGNSFHSVAVGCLIDLWLWTVCVRTDPLTAGAIVTKWHEEMGQDASSLDGPVADEGEEVAAASLSEDEHQAMAHLRASPDAEWLRLASHSSLGLHDPRLLAVRLVSHYLRRVEYRGSDVRLDLNLVFKPDSVTRTSIDPRRWVWRTGQSYPFPGGQHINMLELKAILRALEWRARSSNFKSVRFMHLSDSQICLAVLCKGRSSSRAINRILRRIHALCLALNLYPIWAWVASRLNPADGPSRRYAKKN